MAVHAHNSQKLTLEKCLPHFGFHLAPDSLEAVNIVGVRFNSNFININKSYHISTKQIHGTQGEKNKQILCDMLLESEIPNPPGSLASIITACGTRICFLIPSNKISGVSEWNRKVAGHWQSQAGLFLFPYKHISERLLCRMETNILEYCRIVDWQNQSGSRGE